MRAISHAREVLGLSQVGFARVCDCKLSSVRFREYGRRGVPEQLADTLAQKYGFSRKSLLQNKPGRCLMWDGKPATAEAVQAWRKFKPSESAVDGLARRAGILISHLVRRSRNQDQRYYRGLLTELSSLVEKYNRGEEGPQVQSATRRNCHWDTLAKDLPALWDVILHAPETEKLRARVHPDTLVSVSYSAVELMIPLLRRASDEAGESIDAFSSALEYRVQIHAFNQTVKFSAQRYHGHTAEPGLGPST